MNHQWNDTFQRAANRYHEAEKRCRRLEDELKTETEENSVLKELIQKLENDLKSSQKHSYSRSSSREICSKDDVEALKMQVCYDQCLTVAAPALKNLKEVGGF